MVKFLDFPKSAYAYFDGRNTIKRAISYIIDHKYRKSVSVVPWLREQFYSASPELKEQVKKIVNHIKADDFDKRALTLYHWVAKNITYTSDHKKWGYAEKWEDVNNVFETRKGDCESGALLLYVMCRLAGIPEYKLFIIAGSVQGGGHAWVAYRPQPHWMVFLDWCYWPDLRPMSKRGAFFIIDNQIHGSDSRYYYTWFVFNEKKSIVAFKSILNKGV